VYQGGIIYVILACYLAAVLLLTGGIKIKQFEKERKKIGWPFFTRAGPGYHHT
jgi:hypothetical protein